MAAFQKFQDFAEQVLRAKHDFNGHTFKAVFTNAAPLPTNTMLSDITQISAGGGYSTGGFTVTLSITETGGVAKVTLTDYTFTASGGSVGPFRYVVMYNDTATSPADALVCWFDYGASITLADTETFTLDGDATNGLFQLA